MAHHSKNIAIYFALLFLASCTPFSRSEVPTVEATSVKKSLPQPTLSYPSPTTLPSSFTISPPTPTNFFPPTIPATLVAENTSLFQYVTSLSGFLSNSTGELQVRAIDDGSVWIITSPTIVRWDGQALKVVLSDDEGMLAAVDDSGKSWVLNSDTGEIAAWQDNQWTTYTTESGWTSVGTFEINWWAPAPWKISTSADRTLWVPMERDVRAFNGTSWSIYTMEDMGFPVLEIEDISIVHCLATLEDRVDVWVGECYYSGPGLMGGGGVRWFDGQSWHGLDAPIGSQCVSAMEVDQQGNVWLGAYDSVWQYAYTGQAWREYSLPENLLSGFNFTHPRQLIVDQVGDVWVMMQMCGGASCDGPINLYRIHDGEWSLIVEAEYWSSSFKQLILDGDGQAWLFWDEMVYRLDVWPLESLTSIAARGVDEGSDGSIWVVAGSGDDISLQVLEP
ncbi:MAG: hypothetical protein WAV05_06955 [Anaerolineales bacterium]